MQKDKRHVSRLHTDACTAGKSLRATKLGGGTIICSTPLRQRPKKRAQAPMCACVFWCACAARRGNKEFYPSTHLLARIIRVHNQQSRPPIITKPKPNQSKPVGWDADDLPRFIRSLGKFPCRSDSNKMFHKYDLLPKP